MNPIHKLNNGNGGTLCHVCNVIISTKLTSDLLCSNCQERAIKLLKELYSNYDSEDLDSNVEFDSFYKVKEFLKIKE